MINFTQGNLLEADVEAVVNTVNTVGVMGKGIALMFKERFPENFKAYASACKREEIRTGQMFVTASVELNGPRWIINFPTKQHWRGKTKPEWIEQGIKDLLRVIIEKEIKSIAIPPLGCGNGGLNWSDVRPLILQELDTLEGVNVIVYEPTPKYQNIAKQKGVEKLTAARALIAEMVRRYSGFGLDCSILEIQKLAWFLERMMHRHSIENVLKLDFTADRYGPYASRLTHLLNALDGSYLHCEKRLADALPSDIIRFVDAKRTQLTSFLSGPEVAEYADIAEKTDLLIDGFQSPLGMEALATIDWVLSREEAIPTIEGIRTALDNWANNPQAAKRKQRLFSDQLIKAAIDRLVTKTAAA